MQPTCGQREEPDTARGSAAFYWSAHIRALLSTIAPAAVCVELTADWRRSSGIPTFPQEVYAAITWAEANGVPVHPVNHYPDEVQPGWPPVRLDHQALDDPAKLGEFRTAYEAGFLWQARQAFGSLEGGLREYQRNLSPTGPAAVPEPPSESRRDDRIAASVRDVARRYPNRRVAVVFGGAHFAPLKRRLESGADGIQVTASAGAFPLDPSLIQASWHTDDALVLLGTNLDDWRTLGAPQARNHQRTSDILDRLRRERPNDPWTQYFEARWLMLFGELKESRQLLRAISSRTSATTLPYIAEPRWNWPPFRTLEQKARFYLAVADDLSGNRSAAAEGFMALLKLPETELVVPGLPAQRMDLAPFLVIDRPYRGGVFEAFRASLAHRAVR